MKIKRASKTLSLFLAFCMVFTMVPTVAFAETGDVDSGVPLGVSGTITAFADLDESDAQLPNITAQPQGATYTQGEVAVPLSVVASVTDGGTLSYQWYAHGDDGTMQGTAIDDASSSTYTPDTGEFEIGTIYYSCEVTNTNNGKIAIIFSDKAAVTVIASGSTAPTVSGFRAERKGANNVEFYFAPSTTGRYGYDISIKGGTAFSPQLYYTINSVEEFAINETIDGISAADILVIYLKIADEHNVESKLYSLEVPAYTALTDAQPPTIEAQPISATYEQNETAFKLFVSANSTDGGDLSYRWYRNSTSSTVGATEVGTDSYMYTPLTDTVGTTYYYCVVTNTNNDATRNKTATATSQIATVTVEAPSGGTTKIVPAPISGIVSPAVGNLSQTAIPATDQYSASIEWYDPSGTFAGASFASDTVYRLNVVLNAKAGYTFAGLTADDLKGFTVNGIVPSFTNPVSDSLSVIQVEFPATGTVGTDTTKPTVSGFRAERTGEKSIKFFFTPSTTGNFGYSILKKEASAPTDIEMLFAMDSAKERDNTQSSFSFTAEDILVIYLQIENENAVKSEIYSLEVPAYTPPTDAQPPSITAQPISATYVQNETAISLFVFAKKTDGGSLSCQWYSNTTNSTVGGTEVGTNSYTYTPSTAAVGTTYYYCVVTNTNNEATANKTATATSEIATVTVNAPNVTLPTITITKHPQNVTVTQGRINATLTAEAVSNNGKPVLYQWYRFIGGIGGDNVEIMPGATSSNFTIPTGLTAGTYQYLCVFNTDDTDYVDSNSAIVTVKPPSGGSGSGDSGGGSSGDNGGSGVVVTPPAPSAPNAPTQGSVNIHGRVDGSGNVTANITNQTVIDAIDRALTQARQNGTEQNGIILTLNISTGGKPINNLSANLPKEVQDAIIAKGVSGLIITTGGSDIAIGMDLAALREMNRQAGGNINLTATRMNNATLAGNARAAIGNRPVFDLKAIYGNGKQVQNFGAGSVSVTIPYTLGTGENTGDIQAVYVDANDRVQWLISSVYDGLNGVLRFSTNHFSTYGVGYKQGVPSFADIRTHWAKEDIAFVANRGLLSGTSKTTFSPNTAMTRGMFVTALGRLANADVSGYEKSSFTDVKSDSYHMGYVEWANKNNIVKGMGDGKFAPDQSITREQMAVILQSYAKAIGFTLPKVHVENTFADGAKIGAYAKDAVKQMQMAGIISGKNSNLFDPQGTATRAEVSAVLRRFVELAISSDTAQGWTINDSGKWMYYENGKPVTGKKNIGGSAYTFDQYGVTADVPKNLRYTTYTVQKGDSFWLIAHKLGCTMSELERLNNKSRFDLIHPGDVLRVPEE